MVLSLLGGLETPQEHVRTALMLLTDMERALRQLDLILPIEQETDIYAPLRAARERLWRAVNRLERGEP
jgi:hypothetical protein